MIQKIRETLDLIMKNIQLSKKHGKIGTIQYIGFLDKKEKVELEELLKKEKLTFKHDSILESIKVYWK